MNHIQAIAQPGLQKTLQTGGCGECQSSCQSACKTSCTVANQSCAKKEQELVAGRDGKTNRKASR
jgi:predicted ribosomally synthesized six-cysteine peptide SCIFF